MVQSLKRSRSMAICGVLLMLLSLSASSSVFASCRSCNWGTGECMNDGSAGSCNRTIVIVYDENGNVESRTVTCEEEGRCGDWGPPEY